MSFIESIHNIALHSPDKTAIVAYSHGIGTEGSTRLSYAEVYRAMTHCYPLPIPMLGNSWDGDFTLHTTGSTGKPKAVTISQLTVMRNSLNLIHAHGYKEDLQFIIAGPMNHLGCWSKLFPTLMVGGTLHILPDGMKDMEAFFDIMHNHGKRYATFLVPSAIRMLIQFASERLRSCRDCIEFIETGGAPIAHSDMLRLCELLPDSRLYNTYASTEAGIVATYNYNDGLCKPGCCGTPFPDVGFSINSDGVIQGSSDMGYLDEDNMLHITGRTDDIINVGGLKLSPVEIEEAAMAIKGIRDCICISRNHPIMGQVPELLVVMEPDADFSAKTIIRSLAASLVEPYKIPQAVRRVDAISRTYNGKPDRLSYKNI